nr:MAG TPA: hypothetical protein [Caudoviricetes sp.]
MLGFYSLTVICYFHIITIMFSVFFKIKFFQVCHIITTSFLWLQYSLFSCICQ